MRARIVVAGFASGEPPLGRRSIRVRMHVCVVAALALLLIVGSSAARAESLCTDTWTGPSEGAWETASDWSGGVVPSSSDTACIGVGKRVHVASGSQRAAVVQGEGTLEVWSGSLELASAFEISRVHGFVMYGGTLMGIGTLEVSSSFEWRMEGTLAGAGSLVIASSATGTVYRPEYGFYEHLLERDLVIDGALIENASTSIVAAEGITITNRGTFVGVGSGIRLGSGTPTFVNEGTLEVATPESSDPFRMEVNFDNEGAVKVESGYLAVEADGSSGAAASWSARSGSYVDFLKGEYSFTDGSWSGRVALGTR
jgi:hypothetical protein